ncbi:MAG: S-layer homology domain-containing protein [Acutalibacteraceae bacterium]
MLWAGDNGITNGTSATTFSPDLDCTRGQTVTFLYRCMGE